MACVNPQNIYAPYTDENGITAYRACVGKQDASH